MISSMGQMNLLLVLDKIAWNYTTVCKQMCCYWIVAPSAEAVEYTDSFSAEG